jgi:hypothetical protein
MAEALPIHCSLPASTLTASERPDPVTVVRAFAFV